MDQQAMYEKIHNQTLFKGLSDDEFTIAMNQCKLSYYRKAEKVDYFKTPDEGLLLILQGMAEVFIVVEDGRSTILEVLQEGEVIHKSVAWIGHHLNFDTMDLIDYLNPTWDQHDLENYAKLFGTKTFERHRALDDALTTAHLFVELLRHLESKGVTTLAALLRIKHGKSQQNITVF